MQKDLFLKTEGNNYYSRNQQNLDVMNQTFDELYLGYKKYIKEGMVILEIGSSDGHNLFKLTEDISCMAYGIDPSIDAITDGKQRFPHLQLKVGTADQLDFPNESIDIVIFGFCLYLVDRKLLAKVIAETDRVTKENAYIGITDFDVKIPKKRKYKHFEDIYSYKYDYSKLFLAYPHYSLIEKWNKPSKEEVFNKNIVERIGSTVLFKNHKNSYLFEAD